MEDFPTRVAVELTNYCNLSCSVCPRHHIEMEHGRMSWELWTKLIDEISQYHTTLIPAWRGELMCHPQAAEMLFYAVRRVHDIVLVSNGTLIDSFSLPVELLSEFSAFNISIQGSDSLKGLKYLSKYVLRKELMATRVVGMAKDTGLKPFGEATRLAGRTRTYRQHTINGVWGQVKDRPIKLRRWCKRLDYELCITWNGQVSRCCYVWEPLKYCNVKTRTIKEAWHNSIELHKVRSLYPDPICGGCDQWAGDGSTL